MAHCGSIEEILTGKARLTRRRWTSLFTALKAESGLERRQFQTHGADLMLPRSNRTDAGAAGTGQAPMLIIGSVLSAYALHRGPRLLEAGTMP